MHIWLQISFLWGYLFLCRICIVVIGAGQKGAGDGGGGGGGALLSGVVIGNLSSLDFLGLS